MQITITTGMQIAEEVKLAKKQKIALRVTFWKSWEKLLLRIASLNTFFLEHSWTLAFISSAKVNQSINMEDLWLFFIKKSQIRIMIELKKRTSAPASLLSLFYMILFPSNFHFFQWQNQKYDLHLAISRSWCLDAA